MRRIFRIFRILLTGFWPFVLTAVLGGVLVVGVQFAIRFLRTPSTGPLAVVDGQPISLGTFQAEVLRRGGESTYASPQQRRELLDEMIRVKVLASNAQKAGYLDDPDVKREIDRLMADKYQRENIDEPLADLQVNDGDITDYYHAHIGSFTTPEAAHAAVIAVTVPAGATDDERQTLQERADHVRALAVAKPNAANFSDLVAQYSDDMDTRMQGGDMGWLTDGQDNPRWESAITKGIFDLNNAGDISTVIATRSGFYIVRLLEDRPAFVRPLPEVRNSIRQALVKEQRQHRAAKLYATALANVTVSVNEAGIAAMEAAEKAVVDLPHDSAPEPKG